MRFLAALLSRSNQPRAPFDQHPVRRSLAARKSAFRRRLLFLEQLEDRRLLAVISWDGGGGDLDWNNALNWSGDVLPSSSDDVTINVAGDVTIVHSSGAADIQSLVSFESIDWTGGSLTVHANSTVNAHFNNSGIVEVAAGTLALWYGGVHSGSFTGADGTTLIFGESEFQPSSSLDADQVVFTRISHLQGGIDFQGAYNARSRTTVNCQVGMSGPVNSLGTAVDLNDGLNLHGNSVAIDVLTFSNGTLGGSGTVTVNQRLDWTGGQMVGSGTTAVSAGAVLNISGGGLTPGRTLNNWGMATWTNGNMQISSGAVLNNFGQFVVQADGRMNGGVYGSLGDFNNFGTFHKDGGSGSTEWEAHFNNSGIVEVAAGTLALWYGGVHSGSFTGADGTTLIFGESEFQPSSSLDADQVVFTRISHLQGGSAVGGIYHAMSGTVNVGVAFTGIVDVEIGGLIAGSEYNQLHVFSDLGLSAQLKINVTNGFSPHHGDSFTIINKVSTGFVAGLFDGVPEGGLVIAAGGSQFEVSYVGGDGNDVTLKYINRPPVANAGGLYSIAEGSSLVLNGFGSYDPDPLDILTYSWDVNGDGAFGDASGVSPTLTWTQLQLLGINDGPRTVSNVRVRVDDGHAHVVDSPATTITVRNVAPHEVIIAASVGELVFAVGSSQSFSGSFMDVGTVDTHTAVWTFTHTNAAGTLVTETRVGTVTQGSGSGTVIDSFSFSEAGVYQVTLTVTDDDTGATSSVTSLFVVYDPSAGFVTGGGWINSPAGAFTANPLLTGKANFGFSSKYQSGSNVPTGNTEFQFKAGDFNFKSNSYEWLVVSGAKARFRGVGTVNGIGGYGFELTAWDGQINGGGGVDKFRIKIWLGNQGNGVVYDNMMGAPDGANPTTALGGGSIVIHKSGQALLASGRVAVGKAGGSLSQESLNHAVDQAITYWQNNGVDADAASSLRQIHVEVADLADAALGIASDTDYVWIDRDAAGYGWQIDSLGAPNPSLAGGMNLLSVVAHELGHQLGLEHSHDDSDVMAPMLVAGVRKMVSSFGQPLAFFGPSLVLPVSLPLDVTRPSAHGTVRLPNEDVEENQARDQMFAMLDDRPAKELVQSPTIASKSPYDEPQKPAAEAEDSLAEDLLEVITLDRLAIHG